MPWESKTVEGNREAFVAEAKQASNFSALCRKYGITRRTGYKWIGRAKNNEALSDRSHAPKSIGNKTDPKTEELILAVRKENPSWGGNTIHKVLENQGHTGLPCVKTCNNIIKRNGCVDPQEALKHKAFQRFERKNCNELWQIDFKGDFALLDGSRCFPLDILDDCSRFSIMIDPKSSPGEPKESVERAFYTFGMPDTILSDNGAQFAGFRGGYTQFERWLMEHDVLPIHGRLMHPQTQGKIERFHRTMKEELLKTRQFADLADADRQIQQWRIKYNEIRPHHALSMKCPADIYTPSSREYKSDISPFDYDGHVRKVNSWGYLRFDKWKTYLSETFRDTYLEIRANPLGDSFIICFRNFKIAEMSAIDGSLINRKISRL